MISVTPNAAEQIRSSARQGGMENMPLRVAVTTQQDGSFHYALGFDDNKHEGDKAFQSEGIDIVVAPQSMDKLTGTIIDYVDIEGKMEIIFINPNDPAQQKQG
jgi:iron-sulfur cluster assembly accessory protein